MPIESNKSLYSSLAQVAGIETTIDELAGCEGLVNSLISIVRGARLDPLEAIEPATIFHHPLPDITEPIIQKLNPALAGPYSEPTASDLNYISLSEASTLIKAKKLSPLELTRAVLAQIEKVNPKVEAFVTILNQQALSEAAQAEKEIARGNWLGPLHGIPLVLKDIIETRNILTTGSSRVLADYIPDRQAAVAEKLETAGSVLVGKVHTHEFAYGVVCPPTKNPYNVDCIPGGSSGGSAAAVSSGMATIAIGTDTAGSIRIPSALCGTVGLKPTYGRVSRRGVLPLSWSLDHVGPITRTVEDAAITLQTIAGFDPLDGASAPVPVGDYISKLKSGIKSIKIGACRGPFFEVMQPAVRTAMNEATTILSELGAQVRDIEIPHIEEAGAIDLLITLVEASSYHQKWLRNKPEAYQPDVRLFLKAGELILATDYLLAQRRRTVFNKGILNLFNGVDILLMPTQPFVAPKIGQVAANLPQSEDNVVQACIRYCAPFDISGLPALTLPCGFSEGMPIGLQLVGKPFDEAGILQAGYAFEHFTQFYKQHPVF